MSRTSKIFFKSNVFPACDALIAQGIRPTIGKVRHQMGVKNGSNGTLQGLINEWYQTTRATEVEKLNEGLSVEADLPVEIIELTRAFYNGITEHARANIDDYKSVLSQDRVWIDDQLRELAQVHEQYEGRIDLQSNAINKLEEQLKTAREENERLQHLAQDRHADIRTLTEQLTALQHQSQMEINALRQRNEELQETATMAKANQRMTEQHLSSQVRLMQHTVDDALKALQGVKLDADNADALTAIELCTELLARVKTPSEKDA